MSNKKKSIDADTRCAIGKMIKNARITSALSDPGQRAFARKLNISQATLSKYERGVVNPPGHIVFHCMNICLGRRDVLWDNEEDAPNQP